MKLLLKSFICNVSYALHLPKYLGFFRRNKILFLMYHRILKSYSENPLKHLNEYSISESQFEDQMAYLSRHCNVISASEAIAGKNISKDKKNVVVTLDDGYKNNYTNAFPILLKYNFPALFSITTGFVANRIPMWFDILEYAVANTHQKTARIKWKDTYIPFRLETTTEKIKFFKWLHSKCIEIIQEERDQFISNILIELNVTINNEKIFEDPDYAPLSAQEIRIMSESKIAEFATHSVHHYLLSRVSLPTLKNELISSKSTVEHITGLPCKYFCIPGGFYNNSVIDVILNAGFEKIFSSDIIEIDPMSIGNVIGRYGITRYITKELFADIINGPFHWIYYSLKSRNNSNK
ncbi:MAG: hypothetical protein A2W22_02765 [Candidatus Levybacteria bacterium RBG_16_35_11]|nr:MAG: hypothetical protein A2W22_02765 [Candidatus Levybacteria bacterium RBG_16_35_11]